MYYKSVRVDFIKNIKRSIEITFKSKWLILLSVFVVSVSAFSQSSNFNSNYSSKSSSSMSRFSTPNTFNPTPETTKAAENFVSSMAADSVLGVFLFILLIISLIVISIIIKIYASNFAVGNLYYGIKEVDEGREASLEVVAIKSRTKIWNLFWTSFISSLISMLILLPFVILVFIGLMNNNLIALSYVGGFLGVIAILLYSLSDIYQTYLVLFFDKSGFEAVRLSLKYSFKYFMENIVLRFSQCLLGCLTCTISAVISGIILGIIALVATVFVGSVIAGGVIGFIISTPFVVIALLAGLAVLSVVGAVVNLFYSAYTYLFNNDILKEEK